MPNFRISKRIDAEPVDWSDLAFSPEHGASLQFLGVVRELEEGRPLQGIRYSCYEKMAWQVLERTIEEARASFGEHGLTFHHRLGMVPVAEPSVLVQVSTGHSQKAFALCQHYLHAVKTRLPVWKEPIFAS